MPKLQKIFPMIALAALMITLPQAPANAKSQEQCTEECVTKLHDSPYVQCKEKNHCDEKTPIKDNECKKECKRKYNDPKYNKCKKECVDGKDKKASKKGKRFKK